MMNNPLPVPPPETTPAASRSDQGVFHQLQYVIGVALVLATLFTAWTPGSLSPADFGGIYGDQIAAANPTPTAAAAGEPTEVPRGRPLVGIVSGHWGNDSGSVCSDGYTEAELNQSIAGLVQKKLVDQGIDVELLKEFDPRLTGFKATVLVSIHADSCDFINDAATGYKVASALASPHQDQATRLTSCLRARYGQSTGMSLHSTSVTNDMTSYHAFSEIDESTTSAIIEVGFLNLDRQFLTQNPDKAATGIVDGVLCYLYNESITTEAGTPAPVPPPTSQPTP